MATADGRLEDDPADTCRGVDSAGMPIVIEEGTQLPIESEWRDRYDDWSGYWRNKNRQGPNYVLRVARAVAGLFQAEPPAYNPPVDDPAVSLRELADVTTEGVALAAGQSVCFLRPTDTGSGEWVLSVLSAQRVEFEFQHKRLREAVVWKTFEGDRASYALTEHYRRQRDGSYEVTSTLWEAAINSDGTVTLSTRIDDLTALRDDAPIDQLPEVESRQLFAFVWDWWDNLPAPIYVTSEHLLDYLTVLHAKDTEDAKLPGTLLFVPEETIVANRLGSNEQRIDHRLPSGISTGKNLIGVPGDQLRQDGAEAFVDSITVNDPMTARKRIVIVADEFYEDGCGIAPATLGRAQPSGAMFAESGEAKKADQQVSVMTVAGPAERWGEVLQAAVDHIEDREPGSDVETSVVITAGLRQSELERADTIGAYRSAQAMSSDTAVARAQPELEGDELTDEQDRVRQENLIVPPREF